MHLEISRLTVYPVKSFAGAVVDAFDIDTAGPVGDRRWMVVDSGGNTLTARRHPQMLGATAGPIAGGVRLGSEALGSLDVAEPIDGRVLDVTTSRLSTAADAGDEAAAWCSELVGRPARLAWLDEPARRGMSERHGGTVADPLALVDTGPVHVFTAASLRQLDVWAAQAHEEAASMALAVGDPAPAPYRPFDVRRFRPNVVVEGDVDPFAEDDWARFTLGDVDLRFADHCGRCVMTTIDPDTCAKGREPLRTLARHRRRDGEIWFGIQAVPLRSGRIAVGDPVAAAATMAG